MRSPISWSRDTLTLRSRAPLTHDPLDIISYLGFGVGIGVCFGSERVFLAASVAEFSPSRHPTVGFFRPVQQFLGTILFTLSRPRHTSFSVLSGLFCGKCGLDSVHLVGDQSRRIIDSVHALDASPPTGAL